MYDPKDDGKTHINIYSKGRTKLGKWLSNFTECKIKTKHGTFKSVEGYWYWLGVRDDRLKQLFGFPAKMLGRSISPKKELSKSKFKGYIKKAIKEKINNNKAMKKRFIKSTLPFTHYYYKDGIVSYPVKHLWLVSFHNSLRRKLK